MSPIGNHENEQKSEGSMRPSGSIKTAILATLVLGANGFTIPVLLAHASSPLSISSPIKHVVIIYEENHSFDNVLGKLCVIDNRCAGTETGLLPGNVPIALAQSPDIVANVSHDRSSQLKSIWNGKMTGFAFIGGCTPDTHYACYAQYNPSQIPNLAALARGFGIQDHFFELGTSSSWGTHLDLVSANLDGFYGDNPNTGLAGRLWGCSGQSNVLWQANPTATPISVPACVPKSDGSGPYRASPVQYVPTIMDRLDQAGLTWKLYAGDQKTQNGYGWAICPTFAECIYSTQANNMVSAKQVLVDAAAGTLPSFSVVTRVATMSQHNNQPMSVGDNYIGQIVSSIEHGPSWGSTAIFITYDDCGCFYDHVAPPPGMGLRLPMVEVSPWVKPACTDSNTASFASLLAFTEAIYGLQPLFINDANAYNLATCFNFAQAPRPPLPMVTTKIPVAEQLWIQAHPNIDSPATDAT
jgi:phospholipase C